MRVFVYYNLHRNCWSVKALEGENKGRVIAHCKYALLTDCVMKVSEKGRQRVLREKKKNVHAGIVGHVNSAIPIFNMLGYHDNEIRYSLYPLRQEITYNPYKYDSFVVKETEQPIYKAAIVKLNDRTVTAYN